MHQLAFSAAPIMLCLTLAAQQPTVQEANKAVARSFFEQVLDQGQLNLYPDSHATGFVAHGTTAITPWPMI